MSDTTLDDQLSALPDASRSSIDASVVWRVGRPAPEVVLEFEGLDVPTDMLGSLASLGWTIPSVPSPPRTAIEWVPDPAAGTAYTIGPWRVKAFVLEPGDWDREAASAVAMHTLAILQRHDAVIEAPDELMSRLDPGAVDGAAPQSGQAAAPAHVHVDGGAPQLIAISSDAVSHPALTNRTAVGGGRNRTEVVWAESTADPTTALTSDAEIAALVAESAHAWVVRYGATPKLPGIGYVAICAAVPDTPADDKKLGKLVAGLGGSIQIASLAPLDPAAGTSGALVFGIIPAKTAEIATSTLRLKSKAAFVRVESA